jgi:hypothetical protein
MNLNNVALDVNDDEENIWVSFLNSNSKQNLQMREREREREII